MRRSLKVTLRRLRSAVDETRRELMSQLRLGGGLRRAAHERRGLKLNIGCGANVEPDWLNLDAVPVSARVYYYNALNPLPIVNGTVQRIHCEHFLEHLEFDHAMAFLEDCHRVLELGGTMRIVVPDVQKYLTAYSAGQADFFASLANIGNPSEPLSTPNMVINQMFRMGGSHRFAWDFETLVLVASKAGFSKVDQSRQHGAPPPYAIDGRDDWRGIESFYAELTR